jgi:hypothetical protein
MRGDDTKSSRSLAEYPSRNAEYPSCKVGSSKLLRAKGGRGFGYAWCTGRSVLSPSGSTTTSMPSGTTSVTSGGCWRRARVDGGGGRKIEVVWPAETGQADEDNGRAGGKGGAEGTNEARQGPGAKGTHTEKINIISKRSKVMTRSKRNVAAGKGGEV